MLLIDVGAKDPEVVKWKEYNVLDLRELLKSKQARSTGTRAELITRLNSLELQPNNEDLVLPEYVSSLSLNIRNTA